MRSVREQEAGIWGLKEERQGCYTGFINKDFYSEVALRHGMRHIQCRPDVDSFSRSALIFQV